MNKSIKQTGRKKAISMQEFNDIMSLAWDNLRDRVLLLLTANLGLRVGEVVRLRLIDVNLDKKVMNIPHIKLKGKRLRDDQLPNSEDYEEMYLPKELVPLLNEYVQSLRHTQWLIPGKSKGKHLTRMQAQTIFYNYAQLLGINASIHSLRHLCGYSVFEETQDVRTVQVLLRHKSSATSMIYTQPTLKMKERILERRGVIGLIEDEGDEKKTP